MYMYSNTSNLSTFHTREHIRNYCNFIDLNCIVNGPELAFPFRFNFDRNPIELAAVSVLETLSRLMLSNWHEGSSSLSDRLALYVAIGGGRTTGLYTRCLLQQQQRTRTVNTNTKHKTKAPTGIAKA